MNELFAEGIARAQMKTADSCARMIVAKVEDDPQVDECTDIFVADLAWLYTRCQVDDVVPVMRDPDEKDEDEEPPRIIDLVADYVRVPFAQRDTEYINTGINLFKLISYAIMVSIKDSEAPELTL